jgi:DNA helicase II / ATP-dependent DNA helicase PcrA
VPASTSGINPRRISLDTTTVHDKRIVDFYTSFIQQTNWARPGGGAYRVIDKDIRAHRADSQTVRGCQHTG